VEGRQAALLRCLSVRPCRPRDNAAWVLPLDGKGEIRHSETPADRIDAPRIIQRKSGMTDADGHHGDRRDDPDRGQRELLIAIANPTGHDRPIAIDTNPQPEGRRRCPASYVRSVRISLVANVVTCCVSAAPSITPWCGRQRLGTCRLLNIWPPTTGAAIAEYFFMYKGKATWWLRRNRHKQPGLPPDVGLLLRPTARA